MSETYFVFARKEPAEALTRLGDVQAPTDAAAAEVARETHGEDWIEMVAIPRKEIAWAIEEKVGA